MDDVSKAPRPEVGDAVAQIRNMRDGGTLVRVELEGEVVAIVDDERAWGGWVAMVRWWSPRSRRCRWETHEAGDFAEDAGTFRIRAKAGKRRRERASI
jgi:hypothetical protein